MGDINKFDELLAELQSLNLVQTASDWAEDIPQDIWDRHFADGYYAIEAEGLHPEEHRWYEVSTTVVSIYGRFLGIVMVSGLNSESMDYTDCHHILRQ